MVVVKEPREAMRNSLLTLCYKYMGRTMVGCGACYMDTCISANDGYIFSMLDLLKWSFVFLYQGMLAIEVRVAYDFLYIGSSHMRVFGNNAIDPI